LAVLLGASDLQAAAPDAGRGTTHQRREFSAANLHTVRVDLHCGQVQIERSETPVVEAELRIRCERDHERCAEKAESLELTGKERSGRLTIEVDGLPHWHSSRGLNVELRVRVPAGAGVDIDLGAGEVQVSDAASDVRVDLGAGQIQLRMPEEAVRSVDARAGVGEARLRGPNGQEIAERRHLVGGAVHWDDGRGQARVDLEVGAGEVTVRLD
jgi:hypothetical protein